MGAGALPPPPTIAPSLDRVVHLWAIAIWTDASNKFISKNAGREDYYAISRTQHSKLEYGLDFFLF